MPETPTTTANGNGANGAAHGWTPEARKKLSDSMIAAHAAKSGPWKGSRKNKRPSKQAAPPPDKKRGRGIRLQPSVVARLRKMLMSGATLEDVATRLTVAKSTVARHKREIGQPGTSLVKKTRGRVVAVDPEVLPRNRSGGLNEVGVITLRQMRNLADRKAKAGYHLNTLELGFMFAQSLLMDTPPDDEDEP